MTGETLIHVDQRLLVFGKAQVIHGLFFAFVLTVSGEAKAGLSLQNLMLLKLSLLDQE